jgi:hypothetical protein
LSRAAHCQTTYIVSRASYDDPAAHIGNSAEDVLATIIPEAADVLDEDETRSRIVDVIRKISLKKVTFSNTQRYTQRSECATVWSLSKVNDGV